MPEKNGHQMDTEQKLQHWMGKIPGYTKELFTPERFPGFLDVMLQYSKYGFDNAVLIAAQCREKYWIGMGNWLWMESVGLTRRLSGRSEIIGISCSLQRKHLVKKKCSLQRKHPVKKKCSLQRKYPVKKKCSLHRGHP